ncbi:MULTISPECIES: hypothetical protein [Streptomyces]|nr:MULTISPECIES: hypothetical protein [Streptomyces]MCM9083311.1 hypothetical protein [Streptomyces spororaveus]MCX5302088.1 hypothetical protein [Streptomyces sp. NBC_00160]
MSKRGPAQRHDVRVRRRVGRGGPGRAKPRAPNTAVGAQGFLRQVTP